KEMSKFSGQNLVTVQINSGVVAQPPKKEEPSKVRSAKDLSRELSMQKAFDTLSQRMSFSDYQRNSMMNEINSGINSLGSDRSQENNKNNNMDNANSMNIHETQFPPQFRKPEIIQKEPSLINERQNQDFRQENMQNQNSNNNYDNMNYNNYNNNATQNQGFPSQQSNQRQAEQVSNNNFINEQSSTFGHNHVAEQDIFSSQNTSENKKEEFSLFEDIPEINESQFKEKNEKTGNNSQEDIFNQYSQKAQTTSGNQVSFEEKKIPDEDFFGEPSKSIMQERNEMPANNFQNNSFQQPQSMNMHQNSMQKQRESFFEKKTINQADLNNSSQDKNQANNQQQQPKQSAEESIDLTEMFNFAKRNR
ncbi:MAG: hypothetical protein ACLFPQ_06205, partial [Candidatus Woesearchaeota archaeon]